MFLQPWWSFFSKTVPFKSDICEPTIRTATIFSQRILLSAKGSSRAINQSFSRMILDRATSSLQALSMKLESYADERFVVPSMNNDSAGIWGVDSCDSLVSINVSKDRFEHLRLCHRRLRVYMNKRIPFPSLRQLRPFDQSKHRLKNDVIQTASCFELHKKTRNWPSFHRCV